jgi:hypothetical protein
MSADRLGAAASTTSTAVTIALSNRLFARRMAVPHYQGKEGAAGGGGVELMLLTVYPFGWTESQTDRDIEHGVRKRNGGLSAGPRLAEEVQ